MLVATIGGAGCVGGSSNSENSGEDESQVEILEREWTVLDVINQEERYGIKGVIQNISDEELGYIRLKATFVDDENTILEQPWMAREFVGRDEKAIFELPYREDRASAPPEAVDDYEIEVGVEPRLTTINDSTISTENVQWEQLDEGPIYGVKGLATNTSNQELSRVMFHANFYDDNTIVYDNRDSVSDLSPDQSYEFSLGNRAGDEYEIEDYTLNITYQTG